MKAINESAPCLLLNLSANCLLNHAEGSGKCKVGLALKCFSKRLFKIRGSRKMGREWPN